MINPLSAEALVEKGRALRFLGRTTEARDALDEALRLSPNNSRARRTRGVLSLTLGDYEGAAIDLSKVIKAGSGVGESYALRGMAHYFLEDYSFSLKDFRTAAGRGSSYPYLPLWIALAHQRLDQSSDAGLQQARGALLGDEDWPAPVIAMFQTPGTAALNAALKLANQGAPQLRRARTGQVHFLHGELLRLRGTRDEAAAAFAAAVRNGDPRTVEHALASQRLAPLNRRGKSEKVD